MTEYLPDIPYGWILGSLWFAGSVFGCWGVYSTKALLPDWLRYLIAIFWPIALPGYCILWVGGLVWHVVKNLAVEAWDAIKGIFEKGGA